MSEHREIGPEEGEYLGGSKEGGRTRVLGIALMVAAVLFWVASPAVLLLPLSGAQKIWMGSASLVLGEVAFWVAAVVLGREVFLRYRRFFDPRLWFGETRR